MSTASVETLPRRERSLSLTRVPSTILVAVTGIVGVAIVIARCPSTVRHPELYAEDGKVWFADAYNSGALNPLLWPHTGYLQSIPRLVADFGLLLPLRWVPTLFLLAAVALQVLPACFLVTYRLENVIPSQLVRVGFALVYLLIPNSQEVNANLTNAQWHLAILAFLVVIAQDNGWVWRTFDVAAVVLCGLTGPFCIVLAPIALMVYLVRRRRWTKILTAILAVLAVVQLAELATSGSYRSHLAPLGVTGSRLAEILGGQVVGGTAIGAAATGVNGLPSHPWLCWALLAAAAALVAFAMWRGPLELCLLNVFAGALLLSALASPVVSAVGFQWQDLTLDAGARYWFLPACALVSDVIWASWFLVSRKHAVAFLPLLCLALVLVFGVRTSFAYQALDPRPNWAAEVSAFDQQHKGTNFTFTETPAAWSFGLTKH